MFSIYKSEFLDLFSFINRFTRQSGKTSAPSAPAVNQPAPSPAPLSKGKDQDGATASLTPSSLQKDGGETPVDSAPRVAPTTNPSTSTARGLLEGIDLTDLNQNTLTDDFQVCKHVSFLLSFLIISAGARLVLLIGVAPESMFDCVQSSIDSNSVLSNFAFCFSFQLQPFVKSMAVFSKQFLGMARQRDTAELNLQSTKGTIFPSLYIQNFFFISSICPFSFPCRTLGSGGG